jgi:hypothetical protein
MVGNAQFACHLLRPSRSPKIIGPYGNKFRNEQKEFKQEEREQTEGKISVTSVASCSKIWNGTSRGSSDLLLGANFRKLSPLFVSIRSLSAVALDCRFVSFIASEGGSIRGYSRWSCSLRVAKRGGQSSCWLSEWARIRASVHNWKKWLRSLNPNSRTTRSSRSRFSRRTLVVRFGFCCNLAVEEFSMARRCSHAALRVGELRRC